MTFNKLTNNYIQTATDQYNQLIWIDASAGTGKTKILVDRVLKLLINNQKNILCLTFTNSAASEMSERINKTIIKWATLKEDLLYKNLEELLSNYAQPQQIRKAKSLFTELPKIGLTIQTLHSFCYKLISSFPIETGISSNCQIIDTPEIHYKIFSNLLRDSKVKTYLQSISTKITEDIIYDLLNSIINRNINFDNEIDESYIYSKLEVYPDNNYYKKINENSNLPILVKILQNGSIRDKKIGEKIDNWYKLSIEQKADKINSYGKIFIDLDSLEKKPISSIVTKNTIYNFPDLQTIISQEQENILMFIKQYNAQKIAERTISLIKIAKKFSDLYKTEKQKKEILDYNDIISLSLNLLTDSHYADWILFNLDYKIDHILIDEAQDNSIEQWQIIAKLCDDFFSGCGTKDIQRTLFVVGDVKQSIYSFQNARPDYFQPMQKYFIQHSNNYHTVELNTSFRSTKPILKLVDSIFNNFRKEIAFNNNQIIHNVQRQKDNGYVELWPLFSITKSNTTNTVSYPSMLTIEKPKENDMDSNYLLAHTIAHKIHEWLKTKRYIAAKNREIIPSDIMILVRHRNKFMSDLINSLKKFDIPTSDRDRFYIMDYMVIQDLVNFSEALLLPQNDLALASLLKSPIFEFSEKNLFDLSYNRNKKSLWTALQLQFNNIADDIKKLVRISKFNSVINLYNYIISTYKHKFISYYGAECLEIIEEFINLIIKFESDNFSSLQSFIHWIKSTNPEIKNDIAIKNNKIRIMTIHNAKGLQSPIVFLADTTTVPKNKMPLVFNEDNIPFWCSNDTNEYCNKLKKLQKNNDYNEYLRLLYVAITRAEDELYITGAGILESKSWYSIISSTENLFQKKTISLYPTFQEKIEVSYIS